MGRTRCRRRGLGHNVGVTLPFENLDRQDRILAVAGVTLAVLLAAMMLLPVPYAVQRPGPTVDTLSERDGTPLIEVDGAPVYPASSGELRLTTVSVSGGPDNPVGAFEALEGWIRGDTSVMPREDAFGEADAEELSDFQQAQMAASQSNAAAAALQELGYVVPMALRVAETIPDSNAAGALDVDDVLTAVVRLDTGARVDLVDFRDLMDFMRGVPPGTTLEVEYDRGGAAGSARFETSPRPDGDTRPGSVLGVYVSADVTLPVDVSFDITNIGGPSAGLMFALGVIEVMTPGTLTGGEAIAGTGTMSVDGYVGGIGGIRQKMHGAARDGATWFLAPVQNCAEVVGYEPAGLSVVAVEDLTQAVDAVEAIAAGDVDLPRCPTP